MKGGLPSIIPGSLRTLLRSRDLITCRALLSIFAVYRIIKINGSIKLNTITDPFKGLSNVLSEHEIRVSSGELFGFGRNFKLRSIELLHLGTAGPNHPVSMLGIWKDIMAWSKSGLYQDFRTYCSLVPGGKDFLSLIDRELEYLNQSKLDFSKLILGRLSEKEEAAGKIRVFAITDVLTQSIFRPLSDGIFSILKSLPMDGTFDQNRPVSHLLSLKDE